MKDRAVYVCLLWLGFTVGTFRKTPSENQIAGVRLMLDPSGLECWDQLATLGSLILLTFRYDLSSMRCLTLSQQIWKTMKAEGKVAHWVLETWKWQRFCHCCTKYLHAHSVKLGHIPCVSLWGMAKPHVCSRLGREIKACQEKPGHCGGVGTGRDGMNKRRVQTKSGLLGLSTINCRVVGASW